MNIDDLAIKSANTQRGGLVPSSTGLTPDALPEVQKNSFGGSADFPGWQAFF